MVKPGLTRWNEGVSVNAENISWFLCIAGVFAMTVGQWSRW